MNWHHHALLIIGWLALGGVFIRVVVRYTRKSLERDTCGEPWEY